VVGPDGKAKQVPLGKGVVDWKKVFTAAKKTGIKNYFVELEQDPSLMALSVPYLKSLKV
ncbi:MAG: sugar phosphate isomerase/epimerase, partial [Proteobacteria bacterium]|nr:sugar phosphate isomerase/epimerase [Pseudomonadota bacterium]